MILCSILKLFVLPNVSGIHRSIKQAGHWMFTLHDSTLNSIQDKKLESQFENDVPKSNLYDRNLLWVDLARNLFFDLKTCKCVLHPNSTMVLILAN